MAGRPSRNVAKTKTRVAPATPTVKPPNKRGPAKRGSSAAATRATASTASTTAVNDPLKDALKVLHAAVMADDRPERFQDLIPEDLLQKLNIRAPQADSNTATSNNATENPTDISVVHPEPRTNSTPLNNNSSSNSVAPETIQISAKEISAAVCSQIQQTGISKHLNPIKGIPCFSGKKVLPDGTAAAPSLVIFLRQIEESFLNDADRVQALRQKCREEAAKVLHRVYSITPKPQYADFEKALRERFRPLLTPAQAKMRLNKIGRASHEKISDFIETLREAQNEFLELVPGCVAESNEILCQKLLEQCPSLLWGTETNSESLFDFELLVRKLMSLMTLYPLNPEYVGTGPYVPNMNPLSVAQAAYNGSQVPPQNSNASNYVHPYPNMENREFNKNVNKPSPLDRLQTLTENQINRLFHLIREPGRRPPHQGGRDQGNDKRRNGSQYEEVNSGNQQTFTAKQTNVPNYQPPTGAYVDRNFL